MTVDRRLLNCAMLENLEGIKDALERGADIDAKDKQGDNALIWAAYKGNTVIVRFLIEKGANVNAKNIYGWDALVYAERECNAKMIELLKESCVKRG